ncbi:hypothetical protein JXA47_08805 [Candidatus Sumerlaeota bacterium]|nr:hypothetical protein [Candidatus Sumerlaeota bacterium]
MPRTPVLPPVGTGFSLLSAPTDVQFDETGFGPREGEATTHTVLALFSFGASSVAAAAEEGGIETIDHIGHRYLNVMGIYTSYTTVVYGR